MLNYRRLYIKFKTFHDWLLYYYAFFLHICYPQYSRYFVVIYIISICMLDGIVMYSLDQMSAEADMQAIAKQDISNFIAYNNAINSGGNDNMDIII